MERDGTTPQDGVQGLEVCRDCGTSFVVPVALLDLIDEGLYLLALHCKNCDRLAVGVHEDAELEQSDFAHDRAIASIASAIELAEVSRFIDEMAGFSEALANDLVLPEDF
jgi:hypothetical protein